MVKFAKHPRYAQRHYEFVAKVLKESAPQGTTEHDYRDRLIRLFIQEFYADNPGFKSGIFREACGQ